MGRKYLNRQAAGYLLEAKACEVVCKELRRIADKFQRAVHVETVVLMSRVKVNTMF